DKQWWEKRLRPECLQSSRVSLSSSFNTLLLPTFEFIILFPFIFFSRKQNDKLLTFPLFSPSVQFLSDYYLPTC
ncbi:hypothetical protein VIGAN_08010000, partial [Vigna angularis var. angularis]